MRENPRKEQTCLKLSTVWTLDKQRGLKVAQLLLKNYLFLSSSLLLLRKFDLVGESAAGEGEGLSSPCPFTGKKSSIRLVGYLGAGFRIRSDIDRIWNQPLKKNWIHDFSRPDPDAGRKTDLLSHL